MERLRLGDPWSYWCTGGRFTRLNDEVTTMEQEFLHEYLIYNIYIYIYVSDST